MKLTTKDWTWIGIGVAAGLLFDYQAKQRAEEVRKTIPDFKSPVPSGFYTLLFGGSAAAAAFIDRRR